MFKTKVLASILLVMAVLFAQVGTAFASPTAQDTTLLIGTIVEVTTETDDAGVTTVLVKYLDEMGETQTARLSVETADALDLVTVDLATQAVTVIALPGQPVEIDPTTVIVDEEPGEEDVHPIAAILASFFGVDAGVVNEYHEDGFGFGVIAQAMWIAHGLNGDVTLARLVLEAKETGDYSAFTLPDGSTPTNWGQFKKAALGKDKKNLGVIVSGHAVLDETEEALVQPGQGNGNGNGNGYGRDNNPGKGKGKNKNP
jgi:hypothetical protein